MKHPPLRYPKSVWIYMLALFAMAWIPFLTKLMLMLLFATALGAPYFRNKFLHPLANPDQAYFKWLKTTPYSASRPLPNGTIHPNWQDLLFLVLLCLPVWPITLVDPVWAIMLCSALLYCSFLMFSFMTARQLLNLGPRWIGYIIVALILMSIRSALYAFERLESPVILLLSILPSFIMAISGLRIMMSRYPWPNLNPKPYELVANRSFANLLYGYADVTQAGEPYTTLRPDGRWPRVPWIDCLAVSLLAGLVMALLDFGTTFVIFFLMMTGVALYARLSIYYINKLGIGGNPFSGIFESPRACALFPVLILFILIILGGIIIHYSAQSFARIFAPLYTIIIYIAAIKLPPSRSSWETMGRWAIQMEPEDRFSGKNSKRRYPLTP